MMPPFVICMIIVMEKINPYHNISENSLDVCFLWQHAMSWMRHHHGNFRQLRGGIICVIVELYNDNTLAPVFIKEEN